MKEEPPVSMFLLTAGTHRSDHPMVMFQRMYIPRTRVTQAMATTTIAMWLMTEDIQHQGIHTCRKVLTRREIETTNPLEISTQVSLLCIFYGCNQSIDDAINLSISKLEKCKKNRIIIIKQYYYDQKAQALIRGF